MNRKRVPKKTCTAYHEAGHAVAAYLLRRKFRFVTIRSRGGYEGYLRHEPRKEAFLGEEEEKPRARSLVERDIIVSLAGSAAVFLLTGSHDRAGAWADRHRAMDLAESVCGSGRECEAYVRWLCVRCEDMLKVQANWHALETLAEELLLHGSVGYRKAVGIVRAAKRQFRRRRWTGAAGQVDAFPASGRR